MENELLPCPFCGRKAVLEPRMLLGREFWRVTCEYCFARTFHEPEKEDAVEEWNRRSE